MHGGLRWFVPGTAAARGTLAGQHRHRVRERAVIVRTIGAHSWNKYLTVVKQSGRYKSKQPHNYNLGVTVSPNRTVECSANQMTSMERFERCSTPCRVNSVDWTIRHTRSEILNGIVPRNPRVQKIKQLRYRYVT